MNNSLIGICFVAIRGRWNYPQVRFLIRIVCRGHAFVSEFRVCHYRFYGLQLVANNRSWRATSFQRASRPRRKILQRWKVSRWLTRRLGHGLKRLHCHNIKTTSNVARKGVWREEAQQMLRFLCKNHVSSIGNRILRLRCPVRGILIVNKAKPDSPSRAMQDRIRARNYACPMEPKHCCHATCWENLDFNQWNKLFGEDF